MKAIELKKVEMVDLEVLQQEVQNFLTYKSSNIKATNSDYLDSLLVIDVLQRLYYNFRGKIERTARNEANLKLQVSDACVLLLCCTFNSSLRNEYDGFVMKKFSRLIHEQLINI